jgi:hypothetical protein
MMGIFEIWLVGFFYVRTMGTFTLLAVKYEWYM